MAPNTEVSSIDVKSKDEEEGMEEVMIESAKNPDEEKPLADDMEQQKMEDGQGQAPEAAKETKTTEVSPGSPSNQQQQQQQRRKRGLLITAVVGLCIVIALLVALLPDWDNNDNSSASSISSTAMNGSENDDRISGSFFKSTSDSPFEAQLPLFSADSITDAYTSREEVESDLQNLARLYLNKFIMDNIRYGGGYGNDGGGFPEIMPISAEDTAREPIPESASAASSNTVGGPAPAPTADAAADEGGAGDAFADVDDFGTYQQEQGVVRSDTVKSNGGHVFTASEDKILVLSLDGQLVSTVAMPPVELPEGGNFQPQPVEPGLPTSSINEDGTATTNSVGMASSAASEPAAEARSSVIAPPWDPKPYIQSLILDSTNDQLIAVVGGYGTSYYYGPPYAITNAEDNTVYLPPIISESKQTKIIVYSIGDTGDLTELSQRTVDGNHINSYSVESNVHIVMKSNLNIWPYLNDPIQRWQSEFKGMNDEEYRIAAIAKSETLIDDFVNAVLDVVTVDDDIMLSRLSVFTDSLPAVDDADEEQTSDFPFYYADVLADSITQVISFDSGAVESGTELAISASTTMQPGSWGFVYATTDWLWVADQGWSWIEEERVHAQKTMLQGFRLNGPSSSLAAAGSVPGSLLSQFAIDFVSGDDSSGEFIRVATTLNFGWRDWGPPVSRTKNQIIILEVPTSGKELIRRGSVEVGKPNEIITAVRFFDDVSYVVTFEQTDPFYVLDLSDVDNPVVLGELEIPGFSQFMHPIKDGDSTMLITVGQDADANGRRTGLQISIFDSTNATDPKLVDKLLVENDPNTSSDTGAAWDERAFRYIQVGDLGRLIIPVQMYAHSWDEFGNTLWNNFEGFMVFGVDISKEVDLIERRGMINHTRSTYPYEKPGVNGGCYCYAQLPERSLVFGGNVMTMKNQKVVSTDLTSDEMLWTLDLGQALECCPNL
eukprot:CAMPEP_0113453596 /NCGR_PEP_ID=MMETSP0014_2-20120614/7435_1 /TAXON_ID=2857 /ORGANISM="Nitzschia sp." /LENGTH=946 /DNA_ID=CAMNT_0000344987 /DNA_START=366 /DNA_END=3206 /DNA_ORIENTATION=+ /assembly_acc=CAM_ASM_000159